MAPLKEFVRSGKTVWGTCAGLIMLANRVEGQCLGGQNTLGGLDITVHRNFFGNQVHSFELALPRPAAEAVCSEVQSELPDQSNENWHVVPKVYKGVFIRAPAVIEIGDGVEDLCPLDDHQLNQCKSNKDVEIDKISVAVKQGNLLGTSFHPELTEDTFWHNYFVNMTKSCSKSN